MIESCVVDASVGIKLFLSEPDSPQAEALFATLADNPFAQCCVPDLFFIECANILWKYVRRFQYPIHNATSDIEALRQLALDVVSTADLLPEAFEIATRHIITAYDACYLALANTLGVPLITADGKLANQMTSHGFDIRVLADLELE